MPGRDISSFHPLFLFHSRGKMNRTIHRIMVAGIIGMLLVAFGDLGQIGRIDSSVIQDEVLPTLVENPWPMFGHDPHHTGQSPFIGPQTNALKWSFPVSSGDIRGITVGADETIYATATDNRLYAIDRNGSLKWSFLTGAIIISTPAIALDRTIYIGTDLRNPQRALII